jgi:hypothetical protein
LKLHKEFLLLGFNGHNVRVAAYTHALYQGLKINGTYNIEVAR